MHIVVKKIYSCSFILFFKLSWAGKSLKKLKKSHIFIVFCCHFLRILIQSFKE